MLDSASNKQLKARNVDQVGNCTGSVLPIGAVLCHDPETPRDMHYSLGGDSSRADVTWASEIRQPCPSCVGAGVSHFL